MLTRIHGRLSGRLALLFGAIVLISCFFPLIGFIFFCICLALYVRGKLCYGEKLFFIFLSATVFNALVYEIFSIVRFHPDIRLAGITYAIFGLIALLVLPTRQHTSLVNRRLLISLAAALIVFVGIIYPVTLGKNTATGHVTATLHLLSSGEDNASHYALFKYAYQHDGYAYAQSSQKAGLIKTLVDYPQGSEFNLAWFAKSILGASYASNDSVLTLAYYTFCACSYALLVFVVLLVGLLYFENENRKITPPQSTIGVILVVTCLAMGPVLTLLGRGFQSQIVAYTYLVALVFGTSQLRFISELRTKLAFVVLMFCGICLSWWFLAPVAILAVLLFLSQHRAQLLNLIARRPAYLAPVLLGLLLAAYPIVLNMIVGSTNSGSINEAGGVNTIAPTTMLLYLLACVVAFISVHTREIFTKYSALGVTLVGWALFTVAVGLYQKMTLHYFAYYYYKSLYTLLPISVILIILLGFWLVGRFAAGMNHARQIVFSTLLIAVFVTGIISIKPVYPRVYVHDWYNNVISRGDIETLYDASRSGYKDAVYIGGCSAGPTYTLNRWSGAFFLSENTWHNRIDSASLASNDDELLSLLKAPLHAKYTVYVHADTACLSTKLKDFIVTQEYPSNLNPHQ